MMLAQLVIKHGIGVRVEAADGLSTQNLFRLEVSGVALVYLCYLDAGSPAHMRYAVRRLRRKLPAATVLLGCLTGVAGATVDELREAAKADLIATNLRDVVRQCLEVARGPISDHDRITVQPRAASSA